MRRPSPTTIIASAALFFSLAGTGIAAKHYLITSLSQVAPRVQRQLQGRPGPVGPAGAPGPQGVAGPAGPTGPAGPGAYVLQTQVNVTHYTGDAVTVGPHSAATAIATCQQGGPIAGSFDGAAGLDVNASKAGVDGSSWVVTATNTTDSALTLQASVSCIAITYQ